MAHMSFVRAPCASPRQVISSCQLVKKNSSLHPNLDRWRCAATATVIEKFDAHFSSLYPHRWPDLRRAMEEPSRHVAYMNVFRSSIGAADWSAPNTDSLTAMLSSVEDMKPAEGLRLLPLQLPIIDLSGRVGRNDSDTSDGGSPTSDSRLKAAYFMDCASVLPALALAPSPGERVLDMCAAPGGKSLLLAAQLFKGNASAECGHPSQLVCNDRSPARRQRLLKVLQDYLPAELLASQRVHVTGHDGALWYKHEPEMYDAILLDAPCSSERHLLQKQRERGKLLTKEEWSPSRSARNAATQLSLLMSALRCLKPGGRLVYSTCSISPLENDGVIAKAVVKMKGALQVQQPSEMRTEFSTAVPGIEETQHGCLLLPDKTSWGPIYFASMLKLP